MKYRDHKGSLAKSMSTQREIKTIDELMQYLNDGWSFLGKEVEEVKFEYCGYDERIDWNTFYVLQRFKGESKFTVVGMSDGELS